MILHPVRVFHGFTGLQTQQNFVSTKVFPVEVMTVVGCHQRDAGVFTDLQESFVDSLLPFQFMILQFQVEIILTHDVPVLFCHFSGAGDILLVEVMGHFAAVAG